ncbi:RluA family pseudouridine synthase [Helicobacter brantae]|uniref:Pseudouridine synthase n=1 Tax=Helicobacter brantae TaxID=375927 RepID=A0A3D8J341_9HELI|nr:RluA family pseudouridine synthase [Helicobacter brantae]RDU71181.1 RluA family pseudouridine synthase [Helicobacter brantae]
MKNFTITCQDLSHSAKLRVDHFLCNALAQSKNQVNQAIKNGLVQINSKVCKKNGELLKVGDKVSFTPLQKPKSECLCEFDYEIEVLYEDEEVLVLNKPPHLVVHSAPSVKEATLVDYLKAKGYQLSNLSGEERFGIVHRLDKDTSGAIAIAKSNQAHIALCKELKEKTMGRYYLALIDLPLKDRVEVECLMGRNPNNRLKMAKLPYGRYSKTTFIPLLGTSPSLVVAKLDTGRTHQIRVHLETLSRHILGDKMYGKKDNSSLRLMLHAYLMYFIHPISQKKILIQAPLFEDMLGFLKQNFSLEDIDEVISQEHILECFGDYF